MFKLSSLFVVKTKNINNQQNTFIAVNKSMGTLRNMLSDIRIDFDTLSQDSFKKIFTGIDQLGVKQGVDSMGLDRYIESCARMSAATGVFSGSGGLLTMAIGVPFDLLNMITQQVRVT